MTPVKVPTPPAAADPQPEWREARPLCSGQCPHNKNNHPSLAFSNMCQLNEEAVSPTGGGPCWPAIESLARLADARPVPDDVRERVGELEAAFMEASRDAGRLKADNKLHQQKADGEYWAWQGDGSDHLETLVCPVLIPASQLAAEVTLRTAAEADRDVAIKAHNICEEERVKHYERADQAEADRDALVPAARAWEEYRAVLPALPFHQHHAARAVLDRLGKPEVTS